MAKLFGRSGPVWAAAAALLAAGCAEMSGLETRARILAEPPCTDVFFPVYFKARSAALPEAARTVIRSAGDHARDCRLARVEVTGLAAPDGPADPALALSRERARRLGQALAAAGLPPSAFHLSPLGEAAPVTAADAGRRRADVYVRFLR